MQPTERGALSLSISMDTIITKRRRFGAIPILVILQLPLAGFLAPGTDLPSLVKQEALFWVFTALPWLRH
jgi:hypothetical protein